MHVKTIARLSLPALAAAAMPFLACSSATEVESARATEEKVTQAVSWDVVPGCANEVAIGGSGTRFDDVWVLGCDLAPGGYSIYHRTSTDDGWTKVNGAGALKMAVDVNGQPWIVNDQHKLLKGALSTPGSAAWTDQQAPCAVDVTVGLPLPADGLSDLSGSLYTVTPWILGCNATSSGQQVYRFAPKMVAPDRAQPGQNWDLLPGNLRTVRMFPYDKLPIGVNASGAVFTATGTSSSTISWTQLAGCVSELSVGMSYVGALGCGGPGNKSIYIRPKSQGSWELFYGAAAKIAQGFVTTWVLGQTGTIYRLDKGSWKDECGYQGEAPCVDPKKGSICDGRLTPVSGICMACGTLGAPGCAAGAACDPGLSVDGGLCAPCGADQQYACTGGNPACANPLYEADPYGKCNPIWGRQGQRCDPHGDACRGSLSCYGGICSIHIPVSADACGETKESCCDLSLNTRKCLAGYHCGTAGFGEPYLCYADGGGQGGGGGPPPACPTGSTTTCGEVCPDGSHVTQWTDAQGTCATHGHLHQVSCALNCGPVLESCGTTCPPSYHATRSDCTVTCGGCYDNGNGAPQANHQYCALN
jgi:hypothetical protein